jgi:hypothetical protein
MQLSKQDVADIIAYLQVPLEATYQTAFAAMPRRWRTVLESPPQP